MPASYEIINYSLRPAKQIERKMIFEGAKRLSEFAHLESYRYVGFGSVFFTDFSMVHRHLNIEKMVSIERDKQKEERFIFNKPFRSIEMQFGESSLVLPQLSWSDHTILWLDYDGRLNGECLADVGSFCANASSGSMLVLSVNSQFPSDCKDPEKLLADEIGSSFVPNGLVKADLKGWNLAKTIRRVVTASIEGALNDRNGVLPEEDRFHWHQVYSFDYADGAKMTTLGGVLCTHRDKPQFDRSSFSKLPYFRDQITDSYRIDVPSLTYRELRHLDKQLPLEDGAKLVMPGIPEKALRKYSEVYRFYPNFAETEQH